MDALTADAPEILLRLVKLTLRYHRVLLEESTVSGRDKWRNRLLSQTRSEGSLELF